MPLLLRVLPLAVQTCVEAWDDNKGTEPLQLLRRMECGTTMKNAHNADGSSNVSSSDLPQPHPYFEPLPAPDTLVNPATAGSVDVPSQSATSTTSGQQQRVRQQSAGKREVAARRRATGRTKNTKYVYAADRQQPSTQPAATEQTVKVETELVEPALQQAPTTDSNSTVPETTDTLAAITAEAEVSTPLTAAGTGDVTSAVGMDIDVAAEQPLVQ